MVAAWKAQKQEDEVGRLRPRFSFTIPDAALLTPPSAREREIAILLLQRCTDKEIAEKLNMKVRTVRTHLERMREKSGQHDRLALGNWALMFPRVST